MADAQMGLVKKGRCGAAVQLTGGELRCQGCMTDGWHKYVQQREPFHLAFFWAGEEELAIPRKVRCMREKGHPLGEYDRHKAALRSGRAAVVWGEP